MKVPAFALLALTGCGSFTHFQTARALPAGAGTFDMQGAMIAMNEGVHFGARLRVGLGRGFEAGVESDVFSLLLLESFEGTSGYGLLLGDLKWQILEEATNDQESGAPVSFALGAGGGSGFQADFYFAQATASREFGGVEPYLAWRYQRVHLDLDPSDIDDLEDLEDSYLDKIIDEVNDSRFGLNHVFLGVKVALTEGISLVPEASWIFGEADGVGSIGLAIVFELGR